MKLVHHLQVTAAERRHVYPVDQALERVCQVLLERQVLEGLGQLRADLAINLDSQVLAQVEQGEWLLLRVSSITGPGALWVEEDGRPVSMNAPDV